ncbi:MAG TPA: PQQ-dependent sugar dehydrogenase [Cyclobacteriaceae bacterium]|nr:PQQ-dependent sugar dehydrogenase [Cyclobacteriaceae bacterium]
MRRLYILLPIIFLASALVAQTLPTGFSRVIVSSTITNPTVMAFAPDGRIFVAQQDGILRVIKNGVQLATPFITLTVNSLGERGLIGIALDPEFTTNNYIYLYYTTATGGFHNRISRFTANGDVALAGSELIILELDPLSSATNHNGGALAFGTDGKLYVAIGENANGVNAQNLDVYHGKFLRINKDGSVPPGNPFPTGSEQRKRVWAYGLRNPYTFSIQPGTGRILVNDVGQVTTEEVNDATTGGKNFGWPTTEGNTTNPNFTSPIFTYAHSGPQPIGCALTGGTFFPSSNTNYPAVYKGKYFFVDLCGNWIYYFDPAVAGSASTQFGLNAGSNVLSLTVGHDGNLYYLSRGDSRLYKIVYTPPSTAPVITVQPQPVSVNAGQTASFSVTVTGAAPLQYQWYKDGTTLAGKTQSSITITSPTSADAGGYYVSVSNADGDALSNSALLTVTTAGNRPPVATIVKPAEGDIYRAGTTIPFEGTGTDPDDGTLPATAFSWAINFHHDTHKHDQPALTGIRSGSFDVPDRGETSSNVWYRFILTVTDAQGVISKDSVDVHPLTSEMNFVTDPAGLQVLLDGQPTTTPVTITSVEGLLRELDVVASQQLNGVDYLFSSWSMGGTAAQTVATPQDNATYTATFSAVTGIGEGNEESLVYPNPASGWIYINEKVNAVSMMNSVGKLIRLNAVVNGQRSVVDVSQLSSGMYVLFYDGKGRRVMIK